MATIKMKILRSAKNTKAEELEFWDEFYYPCFIEPLEKLGFIYESHGCLHRKEEGGAHYIFMRLDDKKFPIGIPDAEFEAMKEICTQDDDGQPHATFRYCMSELHIFIPFYL